MLSGGGSTRSIIEYNETIIDDYGTYVDPRIDSRQVSSIGRTPSQVSEKTISSS